MSDKYLIQVGSHVETFARYEHVTEYIKRLTPGSYKIWVLFETHDVEHKVAHHVTRHDLEQYT